LHAKNVHGLYRIVSDRFGQAALKTRGFLPGEFLVAGKVFSFECFLSSMERQKNNWQNRLSSAFSLDIADAASRPCPLF
jgi:hypothetical protein